MYISRASNFRDLNNHEIKYTQIFRNAHHDKFICIEWQHFRISYAVFNQSIGHPPLVHVLLSSFFTFPFLSLALPIFFFCPSLPFLPEQSHSVSRLEVVGGNRTWVQFVFCCVICVMCIPQLRCSFSVLTLLVGSFDP